MKEGGVSHVTEGGVASVRGRGRYDRLQIVSRLENAFQKVDLDKSETLVRHPPLLA